MIDPPRHLFAGLRVSSQRCASSAKPFAKVVPLEARQRAPVIDSQEALGDPAAHEDGGPQVEAFEQIERGAGVALQAVLEPRPVPGANHAFKGPDLKVIFQGDREEVGATRGKRVRIHDHSSTTAPRATGFGSGTGSAAWILDRVIRSWTR